MALKLSTRTWRAEHILDHAGLRRTESAWVVRRTCFPIDLRKFAQDASASGKHSKLVLLVMPVCVPCSAGRNRQVTPELSPMLGTVSLILRSPRCSQPWMITACSEIDCATTAKRRCLLHNSAVPTDSADVPVSAWSSKAPVTSPEAAGINSSTVAASSSAGECHDCTSTNAIGPNEMILKHLTSRLSQEILQLADLPPVNSNK